MISKRRAELLLMALSLPEPAVDTFARAMVWACPGLDKHCAESPLTVAGIAAGEIPLCDPAELRKAFAPNVVDLFAVKGVWS